MNETSCAAKTVLWRDKAPLTVADHHVRQGPTEHSEAGGDESGKGKPDPQIKLDARRNRINLALI